MPIKKVTGTVKKTQALKRLLVHHKGKPGALIPLLQQAQAIYGYLPEKAMRGISRNLRLSTSQVYGVATFYSQFRLGPAGRNIIKVCHGTACHVAGAEKITSAIERILKISAGQTTADKKFTLGKVACLGCCSLSPVIMVNKTAHGKLAPPKLPAILKRYG